MAERWHTDRINPNAREYVEVADTGSAATELAIAHNLGRIPRGCLVVNNICPSTPAGPVSWYREDGDSAWTEREIFVRFWEANLRVMLEVF